MWCDVMWCDVMWFDVMGLELLIETYLYAKIDNEIMGEMKTYDKSSLDKNENRWYSSDSSYFFRKLWNNEARVVQWLERRLYTAQVGG